MPGWLAFLLLTGLVIGQLLFVSSGGPDRVLARSLVEEALWVQVGSDEEPAPSDGLLAEPPPPGQLASQLDPFEVPAGQPGGLTLGSIPVAFGENAPLDVPERAGMPRAIEPHNSAHRRVEAFDRPPRPGGATPQPARIDAYRKTLLAVYHLEQKGGDLALTPAQARQLLQLVSRMEGVKGAVPEARRIFQEVLTPEQIDLVQARRVARGALSKPPPPEELDRQAQNALKELGE